MSPAHEYIAPRGHSILARRPRPHTRAILRDMKEALLILLGAVIGLLLRALVDPVLDRRKRRSERLERWLEDGVKHAENVLGHITSVRSDVTGPVGFDADEIARAIVRSLTPEFAPDPLAAAAEHEKSDELRALAAKAGEAWMAVRIASMDDEHGVEAEDPLHEPLYAVQWYETSLRNFEYEARRKLAGRD